MTMCERQNPSPYNTYNSSMFRNSMLAYFSDITFGVLPFLSVALGEAKEKNREQ